MPALVLVRVRVVLVLVLVRIVPRGEGEQDARGVGAVARGGDVEKRGPIGREPASGVGARGDEAARDLRAALRDGGVQGRLAVRVRGVEEGGAPGRDRVVGGGGGIGGVERHLVALHLEGRADERVDDVEVAARGGVVHGDRARGVGLERVPARGEERLRRRRRAGAAAAREGVEVVVVGRDDGGRRARRPRGGGEGARGARPRRTPSPRDPDRRARRAGDARPRRAEECALGTAPANVEGRNADEFPLECRGPARSTGALTRGRIRSRPSTRARTVPPRRMFR
jgi:hypothetical protein